MPLNNPEKKGLKPFRLRNKSNDVIKAEVVVPAGDEIEASEYVARQLANQSTGFETVGGSLPQEPTTPTSAGGDDAPEVEEAGGGSARTRSGRRTN